jgi:LacI family transcriptional regulator
VTGERRSTINDVAHLAGVSRMTVSRVLNASSLVSPTTRNRVRRAIHQLDYTPDEHAQRLGAMSPKRPHGDREEPRGSLQ